MGPRIRELTKVTYLIFKHAGKEYGIDRVNRMAAAVAYRAIFAMAPLLIIAVWVVGLVLGGNEAARTEILQAIDRVAGEIVYDAVDTLLLQVSNTGAVTGIVGLLLLAWTGSTLFLELQNDLNDIFDVPYDQTTGVVKAIRKRGLGFVWALGLGLILVVVLLLNNIWQFLGGLLPDSFEPAHDLITLLTPLVSVLVMPLVFVLIFQSLTQVKVRWRAIWWGSFFTASAFLVTSYGVGLYFRFSDPGAAKIAGAFFVILLAAYIFSAVFLFGAEVTKAYETYLRRGHPPGVEEIHEEDFDATVDELERPMPLAAVLGFLAGLFIGWRRR